MKTASFVPVRLMASLLCAPRRPGLGSDAAPTAALPPPAPPMPAWQMPAYQRRQRSRDAIRRWP